MKKKTLSLLLKTSLSITLILISCNGFSQTTFKQYQDGKIWFKLKNNHNLCKETSTNKKIGLDNNNLELATMPFLKNIFLSHPIKRLSRPFPKAYSSEALLNTYLLEFEDIENVDMILAELEESGTVDYSEKVPLDRISLTPNDQYYNSSQMWGLYKINAAQAWNIGIGSSSIIVATTDNAIEINHPDLVNQIWVNTKEIPNNGIDDDNNGYIDDINGYDVGDNDNNPNPPNANFDHGTHVAGITGSQSNNNIGVASIGYGITIMPIKSTRNNAGSNSITDGYNGIYYAVINGANIINCSWGGTGFSNTGQNIVNFAWNNGSIVVAAAGNDNVDNDATSHYPSNYANVIAVASSASNDKKSSFSNYGTNSVDITAPGSNILSTVPFGNYTFMSGTSMASPMVSGLLGLMKSLNPNLPNIDLINCMYNTADNIDAINPSYAGELGAGRINAFAAMNCVVNTLGLPPVANFVANFTTVNAGGTVTFTDQSTLKPTAWLWNFDNQGLGGVTPATANTQGPHRVVYSTPGVYEVSLTVSNANGSNTITKTAYITVDPIGACINLNLDDPTFSGSTSGFHVGWSPLIWTASAPGSGYVTGTNSYGDKAKIEYFPSAMVGASQYVTGAYIWYAKAYAANPTKTIDVNVYDATGGKPGTILGTRTVSMSTIRNGSIRYYKFDPAIIVPSSAEIAVGVDFSNLNWSTDTLAIAANNNGEPSNSTGFEKVAAGTFNTYASRWSGLTISHYIFPELTNSPTTINLSATPTTICEGEIVNYNAAGSTFQDTLLWSFLGTTPNMSNNITEDIIYNTKGTYKTYLQVVGGGCGHYKIDSVTITVNPAPTINMTSSSDTICSGNSVTLNASGANSYLWTPGGSSSTSIVVSPTSNTTYNVTGIKAGCSNNSSKTIYVESVPTASATFTPLTGICPGVNINFDGTNSSGVNVYNWSFPQGSPSSSSSTSPFPIIHFGVGGTHNYSLQVTNTCGSNTFNGIITINNPNIAANATNTSICVGDPVTLTGSGATNYTWDNNVSDGVPFTPTTTKTYTVIGTDGDGCSNTGQITITVNIVDATTSTTGNVITANATPATYQWIDCNNNAIIPNETGQSYTSTMNGNYAVTVTQNGCTKTSACVNIIALGINQLSTNEISIYPNPANTQITVNMGNVSANKVILSDIQGKVIHTSMVNNKNVIVINLNEVNKGIYFLQILGEDSSKIYKVIKQ